jgi:hypothetical protein
MFIVTKIWVSLDKAGIPIFNAVLAFTGHIFDGLKIEKSEKGFFILNHYKVD